ncbi:MAG: molybdopterin converting factor subunit 1 [gamma proteobacterium endosymbiont of Lamellibrachia anaximandri]|nr:molybdopterin converting factor subunit 1 [gamma proteobacterium endosymbiont of Lamellibrachia anaximandri]MBL3532995.1 molybdopterin converting factor subunit 1 [gamma proteobacterium endosymbiont of Lamellibrachia anaximandri]MBL3598918.1 molybdopterin converting factor subunit 1 [gamma proteobacterium endosymbiont of Lamellibrachia anaximandri]
MIKVLFFASLRERLDEESLEMEAEGLADLGVVLMRLRERGGIWSEVFAADQTVMMALNQEMTGADAAVKDGDEVAFFPPVTGG